MVINDEENYDRVRATISMSNLRKLLNHKDYSITKLATRAGVSVSTVNAYLNGQKLPSITTLVSISNYLECNIDFLIGRTNNPMPIDDYYCSAANPTVDEIRYDLMRLSPQKVDLVAAYIKGLIDSDNE